MYLFSYLIFIFMLYSFLGWVLEEVYCYGINKRFKEDGFLKGPFKPMYGFAMAILIYFSEFTYISNIIMFSLCFFVPTFIEYVSGVLMSKLYNKNYWSYIDNKYNIQGMVCLKFSIYWFFISLFVVYILQPLFAGLFINNFNIISNLVPILIGYILIDLILTIRNFRVKAT